MRITSSGLVGINENNPTHALHVKGDTSDTIDETKGTLKLQGTTGGNGLIFGTIASSPYTSYIQSAFVADTSLAQYALALNPIGGSVGIGTTSPNAYTNYTTLTLNGATSSALDFEGGGTLMAEVFATANDLVLQTTNSDGQLIFKSAAGSEAMRIDAAGTVGVGVTPATDWGDDGIQIGAKGTLSGGSSYTGYAFNAYPTSSGWASKYTQTDEASLYLQGAGLHLWYNAALLYPSDAAAE